MSKLVRDRCPVCGTQFREECWSEEDVDYVDEDYTLESPPPPNKVYHCPTCRTKSYADELIDDDSDYAWVY